MQLIRVRTGLLFALTAGVLGVSPGAAQAASQLEQVEQVDQVATLRSELAALRDEYNQRIQAIEARLAALEGSGQARTTGAAQPATAPPAETTVEVPAGAAGAGGPSGPLPIYGNTSAMSKIFNPDIAVVGNVLGAVGENDIESLPSLELNEAEATFQAIVDPYARGDIFLAFGPEGAEVEEGFITFTTLPGDLILKAGKLRAQFGKVNTMHNHVLPWTDRPLVTANLMGGAEGIADGGISVSRLILNPYLFLEATGEIYRGDSEVFDAPTRSDLTYVGRLRGYRDLTEGSNLDLGTSFAFGHNDAGPEFTTRLVGFDATFRYRPLRRAIYRRFTGRSEFVWSRREQVDDQVGAFGFYLSGDYQFARRWFAGARYDFSERAFDASLADKGGSFLLTFWPSEFSQVRGQYRVMRYAEDVTANEVLFQFLFSIGAHGAHAF